MADFEKEFDGMEAEGTSRVEIVQCAYYAIYACNEMNSMTKEDDITKLDVKRKAFRLIEDCINELYEEQCLDD